MIIFPSVAPHYSHSYFMKESWFGLLLCPGAMFDIKPSAFTFSNHTHILCRTLFLYINNYI